MLDKSFENIKTLKDLYSIRATAFKDETIFSYWNNDRSEVVNINSIKFKEDVDNLISYFLANKITNKKIAIICENSYEYFVYVFAIACSNNIAVLLDVNLLKEEFIELLKCNDCDYICHSNKYIDVVNLIIEQYYLPNINMSELKLDHKLVNFDIDIKEDDIALIIFTSGTSGERKGVMISHKNIVFIAKSANGNVDIEGSTYQTLPLYHVFGVVVSMACLVSKYFVFISNSLRHLPKDLLALDFNNYIAVPALLPMIYKCLSTKPQTTLKKVVIGGAGGGEVWYDKFSAINTKLYFGYGMSETSSCVAVESDHEYLHDGSMKIMSGVDIKIDNPNEDGIGEVIIKAPCVTCGYYKMDKHTKELLHDDGYLHSGDLGTINNGRLRIVGRIKNILILPNGENIAPELIEQKILLIEGVKECIVTINNGLLQANIYAPDVDQEKIRKQITEVNNGLNSHMRIANIEFRENEFNKNSTGKIIRYNI